MKNSSSLLLIAAVAMAAQACSNSAGPTVAETPTTPVVVAPSPATVPTADTAFAHEAAMGGMAEVALGQLAGEKAKAANVKNFGMMMITDHSKANDELKSIAAAQHIQLPTELDAKHKALRDSLGKFTGKAFDAAYVKTMLDDHKKDLALMQDEAANGANPDLKAFAAKVAPVIQKHLTAIQQISDGMK